MTTNLVTPEKHSISFYIGKKWLPYPFFAFGLILLVYAIAIMEASPSGDVSFFRNNLGAIFHALQSLTLMLFGVGLHYAKRYHFSWDKNELKYHLPKQKEEVSIPLMEIRKVDIKLTEVIIETNKDVLKLPLDRLSYTNVREIKSYFDRMAK
jgi:hypothetical protein